MAGARNGQVVVAASGELKHEEFFTIKHSQINKHKQVTGAFDDSYVMQTHDIVSFSVMSLESPCCQSQIH